MGVGWELQEYLYIDRGRLECYFQQLSSPSKHERRLKWNAGVSTTGLHVGISSGGTDRHYTDQEKIDTVVKYLEENSLALHHRPTDPFDLENNEPAFLIEKMTARRGIIPRRSGKEHMPALYLWVSLAPDLNTLPSDMDRDDRKSVGPLFLIEDFTLPDASPRAFSAYSALMLFIEDDDLQEAVTREAFEPLAAAAAAERRFARDPVGTLRSIGVRFGAERRIEAIYRVRSACNEEENDMAVSTVGYPIVIRAL